MNHPRGRSGSGGGLLRMAPCANRMHEPVAAACRRGPPALPPLCGQFVRTVRVHSRDNGHVHAREYMLEVLVRRLPVSCDGRHAACTTRDTDTQFQQPGELVKKTSLKLKLKYETVPALTARDTQAVRGGGPDVTSACASEICAS